ncbi:MAG: LPXTG cell wall anchor domain-containing protein [Mycobacteriales bacterium]
MRYTKRWLAGAAGLSLGLIVGMAPAAHADPVTDLTSSLTPAVTGAANMGGTAAKQQFGEAAAPTAARKLAGEVDDEDEPSGNTSSGTLDADDSNGVNLGGIGATVPVVVCGNAVNVVGMDAEAGCRGVNGGTHGGGGNSSAGTLDPDDSNGLNVGGIGATVPIVACGNAVNVIGLAGEALCEGQNGGIGAGGGGNSSEGVLSPDDSNGLNLGGIGATVPIVACGNAVNVIGLDAAAACRGVNGGGGYTSSSCMDDCHSPSCTGGNCTPMSCADDNCTPPSCTDSNCTPPSCTDDDCAPPSCTGSGCVPPSCTDDDCTPPSPGCMGAGCTPPPGCGGEYPPAGCTPPPSGEHHGHHHQHHGVEEAASPSTLPVTGLDTAGIALGGLAMVGLGGGALVAARRRREI